jgi:hypothetical protein
MAFQKEPTRTPAAIGNIVVILKDAVGIDEEPAYQSAHFDISIELSDGTVVTRRGDLAPHITTEQHQALMSFMADLRPQAVNEILGA